MVMRCLDLTLPTPAENLACDEALLDASENGEVTGSLRFWEPQEYFVVLGYANRAASEVNFDACKQVGVPVYRRVSGGGTVLQGPGCLNYNLVLKIDSHAQLSSITSTNEFVMQRHAKVLSTTLGRPVKVQGYTDLAVGDVKFSGNAQRRKRHYLVFHGTFLLDFDLERVERYLRFPSRQPEYRQNRSHEAFLTNLNLPAATIKVALRNIWRAKPQRPPQAPKQRIEQLVRAKYSRNDWNMKFEEILSRRACRKSKWTLRREVHLLGTAARVPHC